MAPSSSIVFTPINLPIDANNFYYITNNSGNWYSGLKGQGTIVGRTHGAISGPQKLCAVYDTKSSAVNNGGSVTDTAVGSEMVGGGTLSLGNCWIKRIGYWPFRVTNAELVRLTT